MWFFVVVVVVVVLFCVAMVTFSTTQASSKNSNSSKVLMEGAVVPEEFSGVPPSLSSFTCMYIYCASEGIFLRSCSASSSRMLGLVTQLWG